VVVGRLLGDRLRELLGHGVWSLDVRSTTLVFRYRSPRHWVDAEHILRVTATPFQKHR